MPDTCFCGAYVCSRCFPGPAESPPADQRRARMSAQAEAQVAARAMEADLPDASPHEARRAYEAFMTIYAPELPAVWDALPARIRRAWGVVVDTVRHRGQGQDTRESADA